MVHEEALKMLAETAQKPAFAKALPLLKAGSEIALRLDERLEFALFWRDGAAVVEERPAQADVEFSFTNEALRCLHEHSGTQLAAFGIAILEQVVAGQMHIRVRGSLWRLATGGYVQIILAAGPELMQYLARHGLSSTGKILDFMRSLKR